MILVFDIETTIKPPEDWVEGTSLLKGGSPSPYDSFNKIVSIHHKEVNVDKAGAFFTTNLSNFQEILDKTTKLIGFNIKFDLSWILECGFKYEGDIYDVQLTEYLLAGGQLIMPSLNTVSASYGLPLKKDKVKEYWIKGINTDEIPTDILHEYGDYDVWLTEQIYNKQQERLNEF